MATTLLQHVKVVDPEGPFHGQTKSFLIAESGQLDVVESPDAVKADRVMDGSGTFLSPGWVDTGTHLQDPGFEWKETQGALATAALRGGFTTLVPYPSTRPIPENAETIKALRAGFAHLPVQIFPLGSATEHQDGKEMAGFFEMHQAGAVAFSDGPTAILSGNTLLRILSYLRGFRGKLMTGGISSDWLREGQMHEGPVSTSLGLSGIPDVAEVISVQKSLNILRYVGAGSIHFQPLSVPKAIQEIAEAAKAGLDVTAGVPLYLFAYQDHDLVSFDENLKLVPPLRSSELTEELKALVASGQVFCLCTGHQAQGLEEKHVEFQQAEPGMLNLQTGFSQAVAGLIAPGVINLDQWISLISLNPRKRFSLPESHISTGADDWTWFDPEKKWTLSAGRIPSRAKNSPHLNQELTGAVLGVATKGAAHFHSHD